MSVTVITHEGRASEPRANRWDVTEHGGLLLIDTDRTVAEYAPGAWIAVELDLTQVDDVAPDGDAQSDVLPPGRAVLVPCKGDRITLYGQPFTVEQSTSDTWAGLVHVTLKPAAR